MTHEDTEEIKGNESLSIEGNDNSTCNHCKYYTEKIDNIEKMLVSITQHLIFTGAKAAHVPQVNPSIVNNISDKNDTANVSVDKITSNLMNVQQKDKKFSKVKRPINMLLGDSITHTINIADLERDTKKFIYLPGKKGT